MLRTRPNPGGGKVSVSHEAELAQAWLEEGEEKKELCTKAKDFYKREP